MTPYPQIQVVKYLKASYTSTLYLKAAYASSLMPHTLVA